MFELKGKYGDCKVFTNNCDNETIGQLTNLLNQESVKGSQIRIMPDTHAGKGCVIGTTMTLRNKVIPNLVGVDIGCLDKNSEILTPMGWQKISEYDGSEILIYDKINDCAFFETPYAYIKEKCNQFYHFKTNKGLDQMLSSEHKMLLWKGYKNKGYNQEIMLAKEFYEKIINMKKSDFYTVKTTFPIKNNGIAFSDDMIRIFLMVSADGNIKQRKNGNYCVELHFTKQRKIDRAKKLLKNANIDYKENIVTDGSTYIYFTTNEINTKDLTIFYGASKSQLEIFIDEIFYWDGTIDEQRNHKFFSTTNKLNADVVQWVFATMGIRAGISIVNDKRNLKWSTIYNVYLTQNEYVSYDNKQVEIVKSEDGFKYCFTTSTGFFIMRRNNCISITGNCGMLAVKLKEKRIDLPLLDSVIRKYIPSGGNVNDEPKESKTSLEVKDLHCYGKSGANIREMLAYQSVGTLGGGNHFIEVNKDDDGYLWLVVHTGSRHLGLEVCDYYQNAGYENLKIKANDGNLASKTKELIDKLKKEGREKEISKELKKFKDNYKENNPSIPYELAYVEGELFNDYIHDMDMVQKHAACNRAEIVRLILKYAKLHEVERFETIHNYIDVENMILRKGSVSAQLGEKLIIPMNMRDGSLICIGKGNPDWNYSAPHGAGRLMSRSVAKESISMSDYKKSMEGIFTTCVNRSTLDESAFAYKPMEEIIENIGDTVDIIAHIRPIYNFKASDGED